MNQVVAVPQTAGPLGAAEQAELARASQRAVKIRRAAGVAGFNGWVTAVFAVSSLPFAPFSAAGFLVTVGLVVVAYNEFRGRSRLLRFDPAAPTCLGWNQVGFLTLIVVYCLWMLATGLLGEGPFAKELAAQPELADALGSLDGLDSLYRIVVAAVYGTVIVLTIAFQGGNAWYYFSRRSQVQQYLRETPAWVLDVQRLTSAV